MMIDNAPLHPEDIEFLNIKLYYFPTNTTSLIQTLDQGIIKVFKDRYKKKFCLISFIDLDNNIYKK